MISIYYKIVSKSSHVLLMHHKVYVVDNVNHQIVGRKLPSIKQVLSVLFFNLKRVKLNLKENARLGLIYKEILLFGKKREYQFEINEILF
jgi:hypothetical protein